MCCKKIDEEGLFMLNNRVKIRRGRSYEEKNQVLVGKNVLLFTFKKGGGELDQVGPGARDNGTDL